MSGFTCADAEPLLPLAASDAIDATAEPALFDHLAGCARCQERLAQHDLIQLALERSFQAAPSRRRPTVIRWLPLAAAAALVLAAGAWWALRPAADPLPPATTTAQRQAAAQPRIVERTLPDGRRVFLIEQDGRRFAVEPDAGDAGHERANGDAMPVGMPLR